MAACELVMQILFNSCLPIAFIWEFFSEVDQRKPFYDRCEANVCHSGKSLKLGLIMTGAVLLTWSV